MRPQLRADDTTVLRFANRLYERAEEPGGWEDALHEIADSLNGTALCIHNYHLRDRRGEAVHVLRGITPEQALEYQQHHSPHNPWMTRLSGTLRRADVMVGHEVCPREELVEGRFYHDFLRPKGLLDVVAVILEAGGGELTTFNVLRGGRCGEFDGGETNLMRRLAPHLCNVHRFQSRFAEIRARRALLREVIDRIPTAVLAVDRYLRVVVTNRAGDALLAMNDGLRVSRGVLEVYDCVARDGLRAAVSSLAAMQLGCGACASVSVPIGRPSRGRAYLATMVPLRAVVTTASGGQACCLLFIDDPALDEPPRLERIQQLWGLTAAEAKVAGLLALGLSPREISDRLEVSFNTVRSHVQKIYLKTGASRQGELVRTLTRLGLTIPDTMLEG